MSGPSRAAVGQYPPSGARTPILAGYNDPYVEQPAPVQRATERAKSGRAGIPSPAVSSVGSASRQQPLMVPSPQQATGSKSPADSARSAGAKESSAADATGAESPEASKKKRSVIAFIACVGVFVALVVVFLVAYFYWPAGAPERFYSKRYCGDIPAWRETNMKHEFDRCSGRSCSTIECGPINDTWCITGPPPFEHRCQCCDWCILRSLACGRRDRTSTSPGFNVNCERRCGNK